MGPIRPSLVLSPHNTEERTAYGRRGASAVLNQSGKEGGTTRATAHGRALLLILISTYSNSLVGMLGRSLGLMIVPVVVDPHGKKETRPTYCYLRQPPLNDVILGSQQYLLHG